MIKNNSDVVAVIVNYNSFRLTIKCVKNLLNIDKNINILIVDNCSKNESVIILKKEFELNNRVRIIENSINSGYARGNNIGIQTARAYLPNAKYVLIVNPDIIIENQKIIMKLKDVLLNNLDCSIVSCNIIFNSEWRGFGDFGWRFPDLKHMIWAGTFLGKIILKDINYQYRGVEINNRLAQVDIIPGCFFLARLDDLKMVGDFDESTFLYFEETILAKKIKNLNKKEMIVIDEYVMHNHQEKDTILLDYKKKLNDRLCFHYSKMIYIKKYSQINMIKKGICIIVNSIDKYLKKIIYGICSILIHHNK